MVRILLGADDGNRTHTLGLGSPYSTTKLHLQTPVIYANFKKLSIKFNSINKILKIY